MTFIQVLARLVPLIVFSTCVRAADPATVQYFKTACGICHGPEGQGIPNLGPALRGNAFLKSADAQAVSDTITKGRIGDTKRLKEFPVPMPGQPIGGKQLQDLVAYLRTDLQAK